MTNPVVSACPQEKQRIPNEETWMLLRRAYADATGKSWDAEDWHEDGMQIPYEIKMDPIRGRGIFVTQIIKKGTRIWKSAQVAKFRDRDTFVNFLESIPHELQCDVLLWAYPMHGKAEVDLDPGSFINHSTDPKEINMNNDGYATRDIRKGESILMNYSDFIEYNAVSWFDEIRSVAWAQQKQEGGGDVQVYESTDSYNQLGAPGSADQIKVPPPNPRTDALVNHDSEEHHLEQQHSSPVLVVGCLAMMISFFVLRKRSFGRLFNNKTLEAKA